MPALITSHDVKICGGEGGKNRVIELTDIQGGRIASGDATKEQNIR